MCIVYVADWFYSAICVTNEATFPSVFFYDQFIRSRIEYYCNANKRKIDNKNKL